MLRVGLVAGIIPLPHLPKWLTDPFGYIRDKFIDLYHGLGGYIQHWIVSPDKPIPGEWQSYLYGNAAGLAFLFIGAVVILSIILVSVRPSGGSRVVRAFIAAAIIGVYPAWFAAANWLSDAGSQVARSIAVDPNDSSKILLLPDIHNVFGAIAGIILLLLLGGGLLLIFFGYEILFVAAGVAGLPLLALSPLGQVFRRKFDQMVVLVVVTSFLGRVLAVGILSVGTLVTTHMPFADSAFGKVLTLAAILAIAIYSQWWLLKQAERVYGDMTGRTLGTSKVTGVVQTVKRPGRREPGMAGAQAAHMRALGAQPLANPALDRSTYRVGSSRVTSTSTPVASPIPVRQSRAAWDGFRRRGR